MLATKFNDKDDKNEGFVNKYYKIIIRNRIIV